MPLKFNKKSEEWSRVEQYREVEQKQKLSTFYRAKPLKSQEKGIHIWMRGMKEKKIERTQMLTFQ